MWRYEHSHRVGYGVFLGLYCLTNSSGKTAARSRLRPIPSCMPSSETPTRVVHLFLGKNFICLAVKGGLLWAWIQVRRNLIFLAKPGVKKTHTLTIDEMPVHAHVQQWVVAGNGFAGGTGAQAGTTSTGNEGGGQSHNNMQPHLVINFIIRAKK